jgi:hypothetical protein
MRRDDGLRSKWEGRLVACIQLACLQLAARSRQPLGLGSQPAVPILATDRSVHDRRWWWPWTLESLGRQWLSIAE